MIAADAHFRMCIYGNHADMERDTMRPYNAHHHNEETCRSSVGSSRNGSWIEIRSGSEGPNYDPYHYDEITVIRADGREATVHRGLAEWMTYHDGHTWRKFEDHYDILRTKFEACVGLTPEEAEKVFHRAKAHRIKHHKCGERHLQWVDGFPGEQLLHCSKCGSILDGTFNHSAIV